MEKQVIQTVFMLLLATFYPLGAQTIRNIWDPPLVNGIAAEVENEIITFEELRREMAPLLRQVQGEARSPAEFDQKMKALYLEVLQSLADRIIIVNEFHKKVADKKFGPIPRSIIENEFDSVLLEDFNNDRTQLLAHLRQQGLTMREFRKRLHEQIIVSVMRGQMRRSQSEISPEKIESFYNENKIHFYQEESVRLRLIMLKPIAEESSDLLMQTARKIIDELNKNAKFEDLAQRYSQDSRKNRGGEWGWINRADLREELSEVAFDLDIGQHSDPVQLSGQVFIMQVDDKRDEGIQPLLEVRERIENILVDQLARQAQQRWLERLRRDAYIKYF